MTAPTTDLIPLPAPAPMAGVELWTVVMEEAGYRCQCERRHPRHRAGRCEKEHGPAGKLLAGPPDPGPDPARAIDRTDPADMVAWCPGCWDLAVKAARKTARDHERMSRFENVEPLF